MKIPVARALAVLTALAAARVAASAEYLLPTNGDNVIGRNGTDVALHEDTLFDIARRNGVGYEELVAAEAEDGGTSPWPAAAKYRLKWWVELKK